MAVLNKNINGQNGNGDFFQEFTKTQDKSCVMGMSNFFWGGYPQPCCCLDRAECLYFEDNFDQGPVGGSPATGWIQCGGTWTLEEDTFEPPIPGQTTELHEAGTAGAILLCQIPHPERSSTMVIHADMHMDETGINQGIIFDATRSDDTGCPTDYSFVRTLYTPFGTAPDEFFGFLQIGTKSLGVIQQISFRADPEDSITGEDLLSVIIDPIRDDVSQVRVSYQVIGSAKGNFTMMCYVPRGGVYAGVGNWGTKVAKFKAFRLFETCHTNRNTNEVCAGNPCTIEGHCVPRALKLTISNVTCSTASGPGDCPNDSGDEGREFDLTFQIDGVDSLVHGPFGHDFYEFIWTTIIDFNCFPDQDLYPEVAELFCGFSSGGGCPGIYDGCGNYQFAQHYDAEESNHPLSEGVIGESATSCTNDPIIIEFTDVSFFHRGPDPPGGGPLCKIVLDATITEA